MQIIYGHQAIKRDKLSFHCTKRSLLMMLVKIMTLMGLQACPLTIFSFYKIMSDCHILDKINSLLNAFMLKIDYTKINEKTLELIE